MPACPPHGAPCQKLHNSQQSTGLGVHRPLTRCVMLQAQPPAPGLHHWSCSPWFKKLNCLGLDGKNGRETAGPAADCCVLNHGKHSIWTCFIPSAHTWFLGQSQNPPCATKTQPLTLTRQGLQTWRLLLPVMPGGILGCNLAWHCWEPVSTMLRGLELRWTSPLQASCLRAPALAVLPASEPEACIPCSPPRGQGVGGGEVSWLAHPCHPSCGPRIPLSQQGAKEPDPQKHAYHRPYTATCRRRPEASACSARKAKQGNASSSTEQE